MPTCPSDEQLAAYAARACSDAEAGRISEHTTDCSKCSQWLEEAEADADLLDELRDAATDEGLLADLPGYRILRRIGEGGMGVVFEAEQERPRRQVALKVVRQAFSSPRARQRFEHEAGILARLSHPGIAQIFAAGSFETATGSQPYFAMELVRGEELLAHADRRELGTRERVELFGRICDAVQHAHQKAVLHRDLKPGNVLVDDRGQPRVLDFGVARVLDDDEVSHTVPGQVVGTVPYMSPEQVRGEHLDLRADVYALGVMLYELLCGQLPYGLSGLPLPQQARVICEQDPVPLGDREPRLRGDLATIARKALDKEPDRRYASVSELAQDLRRYLRDEPVSARPASAVYQLGKFARRNRVLVGGVLAVLLALIGGVITTTIQARVADRERLRAEAETRQAAAARDFLQEVLVQASPLEQTGAEPTIRQALQRALERVDAALVDEPVVDAAVRHTLGKALLGNRDYEGAWEQLGRSLDLYRQAYGERHAQIAYVLADLAEVHEKLGDLAAAERAAGEAASMRDLLGTDAAMILVRVHDSVGIAHHTQGRPEAAESAFRDALAVAETLPESTRRANVAVAKGHLAMALEGRRDEEAEQLYRAAVDGLRDSVGDSHPLLASTLGNYAGFLRSLGRLQPAIALTEEELAIRLVNGQEDSDYVAIARVQLGSLRFEVGDREAGIELVREGLEVLRARFGDHPRVVDALLTYSRLLTGGSDDQAAAALREAVAMGERTVGPRHFLTNVARQRLGALLVGSDPEEAHGLLDEARRIWREDHPGRGLDLADATAAQARAAFRLGRPAEGEALLLALLREVEAAGPEDPAVRGTLEALVGLYRAWGRPEEAERYQARLDG